MVLVDRANYGRVKPVMRAIDLDEDLVLQTLCSGTMVLDRFGLAVEVVKKDGFTVDGSVFIEVDGSKTITMAKSVGLGIIEFSSEFQRLKPDLVIIMGDRYEALAATLAAAFMNIPIAHIQGGEVSGSIDESTRHAITKMSHLHFAATERSANFLCKMGENPEYVHNVGCPAGDYILNLDTRLSENEINSIGVGTKIDLSSPFILVIYHPITTDLHDQKDQINILISALEDSQAQCIWLWPNIDAGSDIISRELRKYREKNNPNWLRMIKNFEPEIFQKILKLCACAVGNSSSFIRDTTFSGTPVVLTGERQVGREYGKNLIQPSFDQQSIRDAIQYQIKHGKYEPDYIYGNGSASDIIVREIKAFVPYHQKKLSYVNVTDTHH